MNQKFYESDLILDYHNFIGMRSSFCLDSVADAKHINLSPLNTSASKHLWSFAKDSRFKKSNIYCDNIYNLPSTFKRKGAAMGYGNKSDFTKDLTCSPSASKYMLKTIFDKNISSKKGFSMYESRQKIPSRGHIPLGPLKVPAPTKYENLKLSKGFTYSMRKKTSVIDKTMSIQSQNNNPGAGRYENPQAMSPRGSYSMTKHRGTGATLFNPKRSTRFFQFKNTVPGPGKYEEIVNMSDRGHYPVTSVTGQGKRLFDKEKREVAFQYKARKNYIPGPGSYRSPSDFGHYDGDVYRKTGAMAYLNDNKSNQSLSKRSSRVQI